MQFQLLKPDQGLQMWARLKPGLDDELSRFWWQEVKDKDADTLPVQPCYIDVSASRGYNAGWKIHTGYCFLVKRCKNCVSLHTQSYRDQPTLYSYHTRRVLRTLMQSIGASNYCTRD